jgi:hypothetical protein
VTKEQAIEFHNSKKWEALSDFEKVEKQLKEPRLLMPSDVFKAALDAVFGRSIIVPDRKKLIEELKTKKK